MTSFFLFLMFGFLNPFTFVLLYLLRTSARYHQLPVFFCFVCFMLIASWCYFSSSRDVCYVFCIKAETVFSALNPLKQTALELY